MPEPGRPFGGDQARGSVGGRCDDGHLVLASAYSSYVAAQIATIAARPANEASLSLTDALSGYTELFSQLLTIGVAGGAVLLVLSPVLKRMMHGVR